MGNRFSLSRQLPLSGERKSLQNLYSCAENPNDPFGNHIVLRDYDFSFAIEIKNQKIPISLQSNLQLQVKITNIGSKTIGGATTLQIENSKNFYERAIISFPRALERGESIFFEFSLINNRSQYAYQTNFSAFDPNFTLNLKLQEQASPLSSSYSGIGFLLPHEYMTADLVDNFHPQIAPQILIFGWVGNGKSTLLNAIYSFFSNKYENISLTGGFSSHVTLELQRFGFPEITTTNGGDGERLVLWDSKGITQEGISRQEFSNHLYNEIENRQVSLVIFVVRGNLAQDPSAWEILKQKMIQTHQQGKRLVLVVTHRDLDNIEYAIESFQEFIWELPGCKIFPLDLSKHEKSQALDKEIGAIIYHLYQLLIATNI